LRVIHFHLARPSCHQRQLCRSLAVACHARWALFRGRRSSFDRPHRSLRRQAAAPSRECIRAILLPLASDGVTGVKFPCLAPVAERIAVPGGSEGDRRQAQLPPQRLRALHEFTACRAAPWRPRQISVRGAPLANCTKMIGRTLLSGFKTRKPPNSIAIGSNAMMTSMVVFMDNSPNEHHNRRRMRRCYSDPSTEH